MKAIRRPNKDEFKQLEAAVNFNEEEQKYWDDLQKRRDSKVDKNDYKRRLEFYFDELKSIKGKFDGRVAIERRLRYGIGHAYEWLGTYILEGHDPKERADMFEKAVLWYQEADDIVGFLSDYALRQAEACFGAARYREEAGLERKITEWLVRRADTLFSLVLGNNFVILDREENDYLRLLADKKIDGAVTGYLFSFKPKSEEEKDKLN
jgi:hypothetical protein